MHSFYEFFAGGGMARAGLGAGWRCLLANDFDAKKGRCYAANWGAAELIVQDVAKLAVRDLPGQADLVWGSFPCQDLSLAGAGAGLKGARSGTFWPFWSLIEGLAQEGRAPRIIVLENVCGALTSHDGHDFTAICEALHRQQYRFGALVIDAAAFVPQSRPRLFIIGVQSTLPIAATLTNGVPDGSWHTRGLIAAYERLPAALRRDWLWWRTGAPAARNISFADIIEDNPADVPWHTSAETAKLLAMMSPRNQEKLAVAKLAGRRMVGGVYKRTRHDADGRKVQRAEVRFDELAGCLRTPAGGSSRQSILVVEGKRVRSRLLSGRETARLMGLPDSYQLPSNYTEAYHLTGDGVVAPVVRYLADTLFEPLLSGDATSIRKAA